MVRRTGRSARQRTRRQGCLTTIVQSSASRPGSRPRGRVVVPELGGRFDQRNLSHKMLMGILGGNEQVRAQHVQARVRAAMDVQVVNEGVRSRQPAHPAIVSVADFTQVQLVRRSRSAGGIRVSASWNVHPTRWRGSRICCVDLRCEICERKNAGRRWSRQRLLPLPRAQTCTRLERARRSSADRQPS